MVGNINPIPQWGEPAVDVESGRWSKNWYPWIVQVLQNLVANKASVADHETRIETAETTLVSIQSEVDGNTAAITTEASTRASADSALASDITTIEATLVGYTPASTVSAAISAEASARASADSAIASSVTSLTTTVNNNTTSISTNTSSINGLEAQWGVSINVNGHVTGLVRLDGGATGSTFRVLADKFIVNHPTSSGVSIQAFTVGLVGGVSTVGINGALMVDGTITADALNVTTLSAVSANAGTITAGVLQSADGNFVIDLTNKTIDIVF